MEDRFVICPVKGGPKSRQPYEGVEILDTHNKDKVILEFPSLSILFSRPTLEDLEKMIDQLNKAYKEGYEDGIWDAKWKDNPF